MEAAWLQTRRYRAGSQDGGGPSRDVEVRHTTQSRTRRRHAASGSRLIEPIVQVDIGEQRRDHRSFPRPLFTNVYDPVLQDSPVGRGPATAHGHGQSDARPFLDAMRERLGKIRVVAASREDPTEMREASSSSNSNVTGAALGFSLHFTSPELHRAQFAVRANH
jgi:hypothetical protein